MEWKKEECGVGGGVDAGKELRRREWKEEMERAAVRESPQH